MKDDKIKTITDLEGCNDDLSSYMVVKNRKIISKSLRHYQSKHFACKYGTKTNSIFQFLIKFPLKKCILLPK